jgi:hypothetical protein
MVEREDVRAAIEARRELGEELEPQVIESFLGASRNGSTSVSRRRRSTTRSRRSQPA